MFGPAQETMSSWTRIARRPTYSRCESNSDQKPISNISCEPSRQDIVHEARQRRQPPSMSPLSDQDIYLFQEGTHLKLYQCLGAHLVSKHGQQGVNFAVWAPNARFVSVLGDFNNWDQRSTPLHLTGASGIWQTFVDGLQPGSRYKYFIESQDGSYRVTKGDPFGFSHHQPPDNSSVVHNLTYEWEDQSWMSNRGAANGLQAPMS